MYTIGISLQFHDTYDKEVTRGIIEFAKSRSSWRLRGPMGGLRDLHLQKGEHLDALITRIEHPSEMKKYEQLDIPVIDIAGAYRYDGVLRVQNDDIITGRKAGNYIRDLGVLSFAYCGVADTRWSSLRFEGLCDALKVPMRKVSVFNRSLSFFKREQTSEALYGFLKNLTVPSAIFCCNDIVALKVTRHILDLSIDIPKEISVVSVDNDPLLCSLAKPALTSIALDCFSIGFTAASLVSSLLDGCTVDMNNPSLIEPLEIIERESTQMMLDHDPVVQKALRFIKDHAVDGISVSDVVDHCSASRRNLEIKWKKVRGKTILQEIVQNRLANAKRLLRESNATVEAIALESGFKTTQRFYAVFKQETRYSPGQWRLRAKG
ncbi:MAG: substrate-binding domain-containing protein [Sphaerochaetaceae bacterium]|nr:substrate-binding domain-containing protein [Sphaerochaetaceae bacterium]